MSVGDCLGGLGIGAASVIAPNYIAEIAPTRVRGRCVTLYQMGIVVGILAAVFVNMLIQRMGDEAWNTATGWRWMFFAGVVPALLFGLMIIPAVESPRWLMKEGRREQALRVLTEINGPDVARSEASQIEETLSLEEGRFSELFTTFRRPLLLGIMLAGLQQMSGITPLFSFLPEIFRSAGAATGDAFRQSVMVSVINLLFTFVALWLIDRAGRKTLDPRRDHFAISFVRGGGLAILRARQRPGDSDFRDELRRGARGGQRRGVLGDYFGNLSDEGSRARDVHRNHGVVAGRLSRQSIISGDAEESRLGRDVLVLQRRRAADDHPGGLAGSGDKRSQPGRNHRNLGAACGSFRFDTFCLKLQAFRQGREERLRCGTGVTCRETI